MDVTCVTVVCSRVTTCSNHLRRASVRDKYECTYEQKHAYSQTRDAHTHTHTHTFAYTGFELKGFHMSFRGVPATNHSPTPSLSDEEVPAHHSGSSSSKQVSQQPRAGLEDLRSIADDIAVELENFKADMKMDQRKQQAEMQAFQAELRQQTHSLKLLESNTSGQDALNELDALRADMRELARAQVCVVCARWMLLVTPVSNSKTSMHAFHCLLVLCILLAPWCCQERSRGPLPATPRLLSWPRAEVLSWQPCQERSLLAPWCCQERSHGLERSPY